MIESMWTRLRIHSLVNHTSDNHDCTFSLGYFFKFLINHYSVFVNEVIPFISSEIHISNQYNAIILKKNIQKNK